MAYSLTWRTFHLVWSLVQSYSSPFLLTGLGWIRRSLKPKWENWGGNVVTFWLHKKLLKSQLLVEAVKKISSKCQHFCFSIYDHKWHWSADHVSRMVLIMVIISYLTDAIESGRVNYLMLNSVDRTDALCDLCNRSPATRWSVYRYAWVNKKEISYAPHYWSECRETTWNPRKWGK